MEDNSDVKQLNNALKTKFTDAVVTENMIDEKINEEVDFYDFLEAISDKSDTITHELEDQQIDSQHPWRRSKIDILEQRRRLKNQLEQRIRTCSIYLKKSNFIQTRDKISFSIGVVNACFSPLIAGRWPHLLPFVYTTQILFLIPVRSFYYKQKTWHYSLYDLCYFVNLLTLVYLWILPSSTILFTVCYMLSHGPLAFAIVLWHNSLVFHSLDKVTSVFIHAYPSLTLCTIRWLLPLNVQRDRYPAIASIGLSLHAGTAIFYTVIFYLIWQLLYCIFIIHGRRDKIDRGLRATSYTWLLGDKNSLVSRLIRKLEFRELNDDGINLYKVAVYFLIQFIYMLITVLPVCLWLYKHMYMNVIFLCIIFTISVYNGASFYIGKLN
ncbi:unnamed protein product [Rotaria sordida]|uniref:Glycerophosphocholine acyltransferase 1 n=1 Tax=Rotaria sordida TaxID=392033 RepID=A0A815A233_9BILA|nr:unnamed protein product [Rotaria sordida]